MKSFLVLCCVILVTSGCVTQSLNPYYTDNNRVELPQLYGEWLSIVQYGNHVENERLSPWNFSNDKIVSFDEENIKSTLNCTYFKIGDNTFVDLLSGQPEPKMNFVWNAGIFLVHTLAKVELDNNSLQITPINDTYLQKLIKEEIITLPSVKTTDNGHQIYITSPHEWAAFLTRFGDHPQVFDKNEVYVFKRK